MKDARIFVSIASYRDPECQYTIQDLFTKACNSDRIVVGVCFQQAPEDEDCFLINCERWASRIRTHFIPHTEAKGPCYARSIIEQQLFMGEEYFLQIDSHFRFVQDWDDVLLEQLSRCKSPKPVLTSHVGGYTLPKEYKPGGLDQAILSPAKGLSVLCGDTFGDQNKDDVFLRIKSRVARTNFHGTPPPSPFWTARFSFAKSTIISEVPYDPHLEYIFFGEEIAMSARLWTYGWDMFNLAVPACYHLISRAHRHWFREVQTSPAQVQAEAAGKHRICCLLGIAGPDDKYLPQLARPYGLGESRTLAQYENFAGVSFKEHTVQERARNGLLKPEELPPAWAEEVREQIMLEAQMKDPQSWAGKDNKQAMDSQFSRTSKAPGMQAQTQELHNARDAVAVQIRAMQAQLHAASNGDIPDAELGLSRAFVSLGRVETAGSCTRQASDAYKRALQLAQSAQSRADVELCESPLWRGRVTQAIGTALLGLGRHGEAKEAFRESLTLAAESLAGTPQGEGSSAEQLLNDVLEGVHGAHEQTDDRQGLRHYIKGISKAVQELRRKRTRMPSSLQTVSHSVPPTGGPTTLRAQVLERAVLCTIATGREDDMRIAQAIFTDFVEARESPGLLRLLGMLQSSGSFLDLEL